MPRLYLSIAMETAPAARHPRADPADPRELPVGDLPADHDELTLEMVTDRERDYSTAVFATDPRMRVNVGIRRRLAAADGQRPREDRAHHLLLMTMPGAPILYYGDEIAWANNIYLGDRNGVRTPMQWSPDRNAGFSRGDPQRLTCPRSWIRYTATRRSTSRRKAAAPRRC